MNSTSRKAFAALAGSVAPLGDAGCSSSPSGPESPVGTVQFWTPQDPTDTEQQAAVDAFNATGQGNVSMSVIVLVPGAGHARCNERPDGRCVRGGGSVRPPRRWPRA